MQEVFTISGSNGASNGVNGFGAADAAVAKLQRILVGLGKKIGDKALIGLRIDGALEAGTVAAVNRAFTVHVGKGQAPARWRTGKLTAISVKSELGSMTQTLLEELARRGGMPAMAPPKKTAAMAKLPPEALEEEVPWYKRPIVIGGAVVGLGIIATGIGIAATMGGKGGREPEPAPAAGLGDFGAFARQHYVAVADLLCNHSASRGLVHGFASYFRSYNPHFDELRFTRAATSCPAYKAAA